MSDKNNNELTVTEGFAVLANQDVLNEALKKTAMVLRAVLLPTFSNRSHSACGIRRCFSGSFVTHRLCHTREPG